MAVRAPGASPGLSAPPARAKATGLSTQDVTSLRDALAAGRRPKVVFTAAAGQIAGQTGQVVGLTDPDGSDEFVVVRFGRDELPFSPTDVSIAPRAPRVPRAVPAEPDPPAPELKLTEPPAPVPREEPTMSPAPVESPAAPSPAAPTTAAPVRKAAKAARPKAPAALTVTLAYAEGEWTVAAQQGTRALAKPYVIRPADAVKMVGLLDVPGVQEAVEQILSTERAAARSAAERLRAELAEIEAKLAELG